MSEYTPLSFVPGEVLTSTKMNMMAQNDASFANGSGINENALDGAKIKDGSIEPVKLSSAIFTQKKNSPGSSQSKTTAEVINSTTVTHTSKTGRVLIISTVVMSVSRYTGGYRIRQGTRVLEEFSTNSVTPIQLTGFAVATAPVDTPTQYDLLAYSQDSGTTWIVHPYHANKILVVDI